MGSHLEAPGSPDPYLVLTIRTSEDETRTMKIAFIQEGNDRTAEIEEWISVLHGRSLRPAKSVIRRYETPDSAHKDGPIRTKHFEKQGMRQSPVYDAGNPAEPQFRGHEKTRSVEYDNIPVTEPTINPDVQPATRKSDGSAPELAEIAFCHHCGKRSPASANFCPFCGTRLHRPEHST